MSKNDFTLKVDEDGWIKDFFKCGCCLNIFYVNQHDRIVMKQWEILDFPKNEDRFLKDCPGCENKVYLDGSEEPDIPIWDVLFGDRDNPYKIGSFDIGGSYPIQDFEEAFNNSNKEKQGE